VCASAAPPRFTPVLWEELVDAWGLSADEAASVDRREGTSCGMCGAHLRSWGLADALLSSVGWEGSLASWVASAPPCRLLEINQAGDLSEWLARMPNRELVEYPEVDMQHLPFADASWDLVVHSDTLEHVDDPIAALRECRRVLVAGGSLCFTIPIIPGRLTRSRRGMAPSFHGTERDPAYLVATEYGADFWVDILAAGFRELRIVVSQWPDAIALIAQ
jgi:SAM-dependent methyltransferase